MRVLQIAEMTSGQQIEFRNYLVKVPGLDYLAIYLAVSDEVRSHLHHSYVDLDARKWFQPSGYLDFRVLSEISQFNPDVTIVGDYVSPITQVAMYWLTIKHRPWVLWAERPGMRQGLYRELGRKFLLFPVSSFASGIFAIGELAVRQYSEVVKGQAPVINLPYFIDVSRYLAIERNAMRPIRPIKFFFAGKLIQRKGVDNLIRAFLKVLETASDASLTIIGDGPDRPVLERLAGEHLTSRIRFEGHQDWSSLPKWYAQHDVFVFPSRHDGWGLPVYEAMAAGMPVIATEAIGAALDLVVDGETGYLVPTDSIDPLAEAMLKLTSQPERVLDLGLNGRKAMENYTLEAGARRFVNAIREVLDNRRVFNPGHRWHKNE